MRQPATLDLSTDTQADQPDTVDLEDRSRKFEMLRESLSEEPNHRSDDVLEEQDAPEDEAEPATVEYVRRPPVVSFSLKYPVRVDGVLYKRFDLWPPSVSTVQDVAKGNLTADEMYAAMGRVPLAVFRALLWPDAEIVSVNARLIAPEIGVS